MDKYNLLQGTFLYVVQATFLPALMLASFVVGFYKTQSILGFLYPYHKRIQPTPFLSACLCQSAHEGFPRSNRENNIIRQQTILNTRYIEPHFIHNNLLQNSNYCSNLQVLVEAGASLLRPLMTAHPQ